MLIGDGCYILALSIIWGICNVRLLTIKWPRVAKYLKCFYLNCVILYLQGTYVEGIKEEVVLSPAHALSLIASGEGIYFLLHLYIETLVGYTKVCLHIPCTSALPIILELWPCASATYMFVCMHILLFSSSFSLDNRI